ncbi:MAG: hypothetical protein ABJB05_01965 [Parafilimonas sp.]
MKHIYKQTFCLFLLFYSLKSISQTDITPKGLINPSFGVNGGDVYPTQIATTNDGHICTAGMFQNTVDFDFTADTFNLSSTYGYNMFIAKYDKQSRLVFAFKLSGLSGYDDITAIATDKEDNIYVTGFFAETIDFDPGPGTANLSTPNYYTYYMFFAKYDKNGNYIFAKPLVTDLDINSLPQINSIKADDDENIFIAGYGKPQSLDFDPGIGVAHPESHGKNDAFFAKYDALGNYIFSKAVGSNLDDACDGIAINKNKDIIIAGDFASSTNDFDPNKGKVTLFFKGDYDAFIGIYDSLGNYKYAFSFGGVKGDFVSDVVTDNDSNIIVTGSFFGNVDFAPDSSVVKRTSDADNDNFLAKYTSTGKVIFVTTVHSDGYAFSCLATDSNNNIYIGGQFNKSVVFTSTDSLVCASGYDGLLAKYNSKGIYVFSRQQVTHKMFPSFMTLALGNNNQIYISSNFDSIAYFGSKKISTQDYNYYIATYNTSTGNNTSANAFATYKKFNVESAVVKMAHDDQNNTYVAGTFQGIVDFDPSIKQYFLTSSQDASTSIFLADYTDDIFFAKYDATGKLVFAKDIGGTAGQAPISIAVDNNHNIYLTGAFEGNIDVDPGKDIVLFKRKYNTSTYKAFFIGKYDSLGNYIFAEPFYINGYLNAMTINNNNDVYIAGSFSSGYFNPDDDTSKISVKGSYLYFAKYNKNGKFMYLKSMGENNKYQFCNDVAINKKGNVLMCGYISGTKIDFDPGIGTYYVNTQLNYVHFLASYSATGNFLFETNSSSLATSSDCRATLLKLDKNDNIIVTGFLDGKIDFNNGRDSLIATAQGTFTTFLSKYDNTGKPLYVKTFSEFHGDAGTGDFRILASAVDNNNNIYLAGNFFGKVDFDASEDTAYITADRNMHSNNNIYLSKYDSAGNYIYAYNFIPTDTFFYRGASAADVWVNKNSDIILAVNTNGKIDFDPGPDTFYYHPPFIGYPSEYQSFSFALVKFKQTQTAKPFRIFASTLKPDADKITTFTLNKLAKYLK